MKTDYDFQDRMAAGRAVADARRARGQHVGKSAKGWDHKRSDYAPIESEIEQFDAESRCRFDHAISQFLEDVTFDVRGGEFDDIRGADGWVEL